MIIVIQCAAMKRSDAGHLLSASGKPVEFVATQTETVYFCGCKHTNTKPLCDGTHETV